LSALRTLPRNSMIANNNCNVTPGQQNNLSVTQPDQIARAFATWAEKSRRHDGSFLFNPKAF
jgi:hypothetical protein